MPAVPASRPRKPGSWNPDDRTDCNDVPLRHRGGVGGCGWCGRRADDAESCQNCNERRSEPNRPFRCHVCPLSSARPCDGISILKSRIRNASGPIARHNRRTALWGAVHCWTPHIRRRRDVCRRGAHPLPGEPDRELSAGAPRRDGGCPRKRASSVPPPRSSTSSAQAVNLYVRTTPEADDHVRAIDEWWRKHRTAAPSLFPRRGWKLHSR
jgi:hypothetical protein